MRALAQRVTRASVSVGGERVAAIGPGLLVLLGITHDDGPAEADRLADKVRALRVFADAQGRMNEPLCERFCARLGARRGRFGAMMDVELVNDGPVTLLLEVP